MIILPSKWCTTTFSMGRILMMYYLPNGHSVSPITSTSQCPQSDWTLHMHLNTRLQHSNSLLLSNASHSGAFRTIQQRLFQLVFQLPEENCFKQIKSTLFRNIDCIDTNIDCIDTNIDCIHWLHHEIRTTRFWAEGKVTIG